MRGLARSDLSIDRHGNLAALFTDDDHHTIRVFGHPNSRAMSHVQVRTDLRVLAQRKLTSRRYRPVTANNEGAVMERILTIKNARDE